MNVSLPAKEGKRWPVWTVAALALLVGMMAGYLIQRQRAAAAMAPPVDRAKLRDEVMSQFGLLQSEPQIAMLGDSITAQGEWSELLGQVVANRGIGGDMSAQLLERVSLIPRSARTVFLMVGINDIAIRPVDEIAANTRRIVAGLSQRRVVVQSVLFTSDPNQSDKIKALNEKNSAYCTTGACRYLELNDLFSRDGLLRSDMTVDGVHLAGRAYPLWAERIKAIAF